MVFSSSEFIFLFLPITVILYYILSPYKNGKISIVFVFISSLFFYAYWKFSNVWILILFIIINFLFGQWIFLAKKYKRYIFIFTIFCNLAALGYFKYTNFFLRSINYLADVNISLINITLPLGISFFVFQKIAYLSDIYAGRHDPTGKGFLNFCLFASFFPQLIAGPIVHHKEMMPQFADMQKRQVNWVNIYEGLFLFSLGLAKKVLIADNLSPISSVAFDRVDTLTFLEASFSSLSYSLQLYFDFSGYSDMAIGSALLFNISLPQNFNSPYRSTDIRDFWQRWHMTLSRWLRDYLYIPLGGSHSGKLRTFVNIFLTFFLSGLWHGAAWTFVLWGAMHGIALIVHRLWTQVSHKRLPKYFAWGLTFCFINFAWIIFRSTSFSCVEKFIRAFAGVNGFLSRRSFREEVTQAVGNGFFSFKYICIFVLIALFISMSKNIFFRGLSVKQTLCTVVLLIASFVFILMPERTSEFIYFQF